MKLRDEIPKQSIAEILTAVNRIEGQLVKLRRNVSSHNWELIAEAEHQLHIIKRLIKMPKTYEAKNGPLH